MTKENRGQDPMVKKAAIEAHKKAVIEAKVGAKIDAEKETKRAEKEGKQAEKIATRDKNEADKVDAASQKYVKESQEKAKIDAKIDAEKEAKRDEKEAKEAEKIALRDEKEADKADAATHFKIKLKKVPEIGDEKEFGDKIPLEENSGEKEPDSSSPAAENVLVGEARELDPGIAGNAGQKEPGEPKNKHKNY